MRELAETLLAIARGRPAAAAGLLHRQDPALDAHHEHQLVPAGRVAGEPRARAVPDRAAHRLRHVHDPGPRARARVVCRSGRPRTTGRTRRTTRTPSPSTPVTCSRGGRGDRWKSNRHRVLPPQAEAPDEDLVSLVYFYEADWDARVESLQPPIGKPNDYPPVVASDFIKRLLDAITVGAVATLWPRYLVGHGPVGSSLLNHGPDRRGRGPARSPIRSRVEAARRAPGRSRCRPHSPCTRPGRHR